MRARGFSLVEFMIAMAIGLFLVAGLVYLIAETSRSRAEMERSSRQIENGRYALDRIAEDLRHAGFYSEYFSVPSAGETGFPASLTAADPCAATIATLPAGMPLAIQAYDGGASVPSDLTTCLASADYQPNTDILVVRRASTSTKAVAALGAAADTNQPFIQSTPLDYKLNLGSAGAAFFDRTLPSANNTATVPAPLHRYVVRIYFVSKCNVPSTGVATDPCDATADGGSPIPTLKMLELGVHPTSFAGPQFNKIAIAEGIEHLQFDFGIDTTGDGVADTVSMCDSTTPCSAIDFSNVVTVQISMVARNTETSPGYSDDKTYNLGLKGYTTATNDYYRRHSYSALVRLNNVAMRRE
jgi:type IV pilus assembly protein PilW